MPKPRLFISHSSKDGDVAKAVSAGLPAARLVRRNTLITRRIRREL